jgi:hypothetical protein
VSVISRSARHLEHAGSPRGWLALWSSCVLVGCGPTLDAHDQGTSGEGASSSSTTMTTAIEASTTSPAEDASRFLGVFHRDDFFGGPIWGEPEIPSLWPLLVNVEIRPDGTAGMFRQSCLVVFDDRPVEVEWRWELARDGWLELRPGPGEASLRFIEPTELASLRATIDDQCTMQFEADGELLGYVFRRGRACWVNRCDPPWTVHIDYCDGEVPPQCP